MTAILKYTVLKSRKRRTGETGNRREGLRFPVSPFLRFGLLASLALTSTAGCRQDMHDQPKYEALEASEFFPDGRAARQLVPGTVARGQLKEDAHLYEGKVNGKPAETFPFPVTLQVLQRG